MIVSKDTGLDRQIDSETDKSNFEPEVLVLRKSVFSLSRARNEYFF